MVKPAFKAAFSVIDFTTQLHQLKPVSLAYQLFVQIQNRCPCMGSAACRKQGSFYAKILSKIMAPIKKLAHPSQINPSPNHQIIYGFR